MTIEQYRALIQQGMEDETTPALVAEWAGSNKGRALRKDNIPDGYVIKKCFGMTHLETLDYLRTGGRTGYSFLLDYSETHVQVPGVEKLRELNTCYYVGREERNKERRALLDDPKRLQHEADVIKQYQDATAAFQETFAYHHVMYRVVDKALER